MYDRLTAHEASFSVAIVDGAADGRSPCGATTHAVYAMHKFLVLPALQAVLANG